MSQGKTIQIYLPDGNARAMKIAEVTSRTIQAIYFSRAHASEAFKRPELNSVGVYFLFGESENQEPTVYIGESEDCTARLRNHHTNKDFWNEAIVMTSKTGFFTKTHAKFLEWKSLEKTLLAKRYLLEENKQRPKKPHLSESAEDDLSDNLETIHLLLNTLGFSVFDPLNSVSQDDLLFCNGRGIEARGRYEEDGMVVLQDSHVALDVTKSLSPGYKSQRDNLIEKGILISTEDSFTFTRDHTFSSPSTAAAVILGRPSNGWTAWKDAAGITMDEKYRNPS